MHDPSSFTIITPCFNEESVIVSFLKKLEDVLSGLQYTFHVVVVDDCSTDSSLQSARSFQFTSPNIKFHLLELMYNVGHQSAIYQGLLYAKTISSDYIIVMDSDGEDDPDAIPLLVQKQGYDIVAAKRGKRKESILFRMSYFLYRLLFKLVTGKKMDYGNYSMISAKMVERITNTSFIHYPAYLLKQKASRTSIIFDRNKRLDGRSKMGMQGLLFHAFRSFIEFAEDLLMLFLKMFVVICIVIAALFCNLLYQKFIARTAILGWFSTLTMSLVNLAVICLGFFVVGILLLNLMHQQNRLHTSIYSIEKTENS